MYISKGRGKTSIGVEELALYAEPGLFLIRPDNSLFYVSSQSMPFARPSLQICWVLYAGYLRKTILRAGMWSEG